MIYLASPYSHPDATVREARFQAACRATASLIRAGHEVFSPIAHSHPLAAFGLPTDWSFWESQAKWYIDSPPTSSRCSRSTVGKLAPA